MYTFCETLAPPFLALIQPLATIRSACSASAPREVLLVRSIPLSAVGEAEGGGAEVDRSMDSFFWSIVFLPPAQYKSIRIRLPLLLVCADAVGLAVAVVHDAPFLDIAVVVDVFVLDAVGFARIDLLSKLFCSAVYSKSLAALSGDSAVPLAQTLRSQLKILQNRVRVCADF